MYDKAIILDTKITPEARVPMPMLISKDRKTMRMLVHARWIVFYPKGKDENGEFKPYIPRSKSEFQSIRRVFQARNVPHKVIPIAEALRSLKDPHQTHMGGKDRPARDAIMDAHEAQLFGWCVEKRFPDADDEVLTVHSTTRHWSKAKKLAVCLKGFGYVDLGKVDE